MTISVWGWGATQISTWGWGSWIYEYIPEIIAEYIDSHAHTCVIDTCGCVTVAEISTSSVVMRLRPCTVPERSHGDPLIRSGDLNHLIRSGGWPQERDPCIDEE